MQKRYLFAGVVITLAVFQLMHVGRYHGAKYEMQQQAAQAERLAITMLASK